MLRGCTVRAAGAIEAAADLREAQDDDGDGAAREDHRDRAPLADEAREHRRHREDAAADDAVDDGGRVAPAPDGAGEGGGDLRPAWRVPVRCRCRWGTTSDSRGRTEHSPGSHPAPSNLALWNLWFLARQVNSSSRRRAPAGLRSGRSARRGRARRRPSAGGDRERRQRALQARPLARGAVRRLLTANEDFRMPATVLAVVFVERHGRSIARTTDSDYGLQTTDTETHEENLWNL